MVCQNWDQNYVLMHLFAMKITNIVIYALHVQM